MIRRQVSLFIVAAQFLTRLPVPVLRNFEPSWLTHSARYFPLVGALVGGINVGVWWLCGHWFAPSVSVGLMMGASLLITGAFHEDGFADTCDGFGGGTTPDHTLAIMKDSRIGAYGAIGVSMMLGLKWVTLVAIPSAVFPVVVIGAHMLSRWCSTGLIWGLRYVRSDGDGKSKPLADSLTGFDWVLSGLIGAAALAPLALTGSRTTSTSTIHACAAAALAAALTAGVAARYCRSRIGGYTGDFLGAVQQVSELTFLLAALASLVPAPSLD